MNLGPTIDGRISPQRQLSSPSALDGSIISTASEQEVFIDFENLYMYCMCVLQVTALRNTVRLLKDELWHIKMNRTSFDLAKLETPISAIKTNEIADIYKNSTLLLNVC